MSKMRYHLVSGYVVLLLAAAAGATAYPGNGGMGFGGPVGTGSLTVTDDGAGNINFSLTAGVPFSGNDLVLYLDTKPGGVNDNAAFTDNGDGGRTAVSGANNGNMSRSLVTFAPGFLADEAISFEPGVFAGLFDLSDPSNFTFLASGNLAGSGSGPFTFSFSRAALGLGPADAFSFEGTLISTTAYRSNESIGASTTIPENAAAAPNAGFNGSTTFSAANTFSVPEPNAIVLIALAGLALRRPRAWGR